ncbi:MAG: RDD family protein [Actinomycetota bacterium]
MNFIRVGLWRRIFALSLDWLACLLIASTFFDTGKGGGSFIPLAIFFGEVWILTTLQGASAGQRVLRIKVIRFADGGRATSRQVFIRTLLLCLVVTAVTFDENGRGLHERISGTVLTRI